MKRVSRKERERHALLVKVAGRHAAAAEAAVSRTAREFAKARGYVRVARAHLLAVIEDAEKAGAL